MTHRTYYSPRIPPVRTTLHSRWDLIPLLDRPSASYTSRSGRYQAPLQRPLTQHPPDKLTIGRKTMSLEAPSWRGAVPLKKKPFVQQRQVCMNLYVHQALRSKLVGWRARSLTRPCPRMTHEAVVRLQCMLYLKRGATLNFTEGTWLQALALNPIRRRFIGSMPCRSGCGIFTLQYQTALTAVSILCQTHSKAELAK